LAAGLATARFRREGVAVDFVDGIYRISKEHASAQILVRLKPWVTFKA